jgi:hypothetical protein
VSEEREERSITTAQLNIEKTTIEAINNISMNRNLKTACPYPGTT